MINSIKIAFTGKAGSGKTTASKMLAEKIDAKILSFASALKMEAIGDYEDITLEDIIEHNYNKVVNGKSIREILQERGMQRREEDPNYWINKLFEQMELLQNMGLYENFIVDDLRFLNEAKALKEKGFIIIRLLREDWYIAEGMNEETARHVSETEQDTIEADYEMVCKTGELMNAVNRICRQI